MNDLPIRQMLSKAPESCETLVSVFGGDGSSRAGSAFICEVSVRMRKLKPLPDGFASSSTTGLHALRATCQFPISKKP